jgi:hypothetical protein
VIGKNKKRAVADALFRLGMQVRAEAVVQALAEQGVKVSEALVTSVRIELLKKDTAHDARRLIDRQRRAMQPNVHRGPKAFPRRGRDR